MNLKLLTPTRIIVDQRVSKVSAEAEHGSFTLLPQHIDFLAALVPGLLSFEDEAGQEEFVAIDQGVLVKQGAEVLVSCQQATRGGALEALRKKVRDEFEFLDDRERAAHAAAARLEASFLRSYLEFAEESS